jgi:hypothetical protein
MRGVIAADACDTALRPGRVKLDTLNIVDDSRCSLLRRMVDGALGIFDGRFSQSNETLQSQ